jgi:excisionase family DNA binding protein
VWFNDSVTTSAERRQRSSPRTAAAIVDAIRSAESSVVALSIGDRRYPLGSDLAELVTNLLEDVSYGREVTSAPANLPIGTEVASELLGVSRPWLTTLLDRGDIPSSRTGTKRRMRLGDVLAFRRADDARRDRQLTWDFLDDAERVPVRATRPRGRRADAGTD